MYNKIEIKMNEEKIVEEGNDVQKVYACLDDIHKDGGFTKKTIMDDGTIVYEGAESFPKVCGVSWTLEAQGWFVFACEKIIWTSQEEDEIEPEIADWTEELREGYMEKYYKKKLGN